MLNINKIMKIFKKTVNFYNATIHGKIKLTEHVNKLVKRT